MMDTDLKTMGFFHFVLNFMFPLSNQSQGCHYKCRLLNLFEVFLPTRCVLSWFLVGENERNGLEGLSKTHVVGENTSLGHSSSLDRT